MATKKNAKKAMSKKTMKKTKGGIIAVLKSGVENPTLPANLGAGKVNVQDLSFTHHYD